MFTLPLHLYQNIIKSERVSSKHQCRQLSSQPIIHYIYNVQRQKAGSTQFSVYTSQYIYTISINPNTSEKKKYIQTLSWEKQTSKPYNYHQFHSINGPEDSSLSKCKSGSSELIENLTHFLLSRYFKQGCMARPANTASRLITSP